MADSPARAVLAASPLFSVLPPEALDALAVRCVRRSFGRGQVIFLTGEPSDSLLLVVSGRVQILVRSADGAELTLDVVPPVRVLGELGVIDGGPRSTSATSIEGTELLAVPRDAVHELLAVHPGVAAQLLLSVSASLRRLTDATADLVFLDLPRRLAKLLIEHPRDDAGEVRLGLTQSQVASRVGGTRQSVNAALRGFERRGWVAVDGKSLAITGPEPLARFAGVDLPALGGRA